MSNVQRPNRLKEKAAEQGKTPEDFVRETVLEEGTIYGAAVKLGVSRNTIAYWLKKMGLKVETSRVTVLQEKQAV